MVALIVLGQIYSRLCLRRTPLGPVSVFERCPLTERQLEDYLHEGGGPQVSEVTRLGVACEQALLGALAAGREKEEEVTTTSLEFEFHLQFPCGFPSTELSDFCQPAGSGNERDCKQTLKNSHLRQSAFRIDFFDASIQVPETYLQALLPFAAPPPERLGELARRLA